jgi:hypothetical protein
MMSIQRQPLIFGALVLMAGCGTLGQDGAGCSDYTDRATGATYRWCGDPKAFGAGTPLRPATELVSLIPVEERIGDAESIFLRVQYQGQSWLYIAPGSTLRLSVDGQPVDIVSPRGSRADSTRQVESRYVAAVQEAADFTTDATLIRSLAAATAVEFILTVGDRKVEGRLSGPNLVPFREFTRNYLDQ